MNDRKYISYLRLSKVSAADKREQEARGFKDPLGIEAQRTIIKHFHPVIEQEFVEIRSAKNMDRPVLQQAIEYCLKHDCWLVVAKVDRLSRRTEDGLYVFDKLGGRLICCDIPGTIEKFLLTIFFAIADRERELISIRVKNALAETKKKGTRLGTSASTNFTPELRERGRNTQKEEAAANPANTRALSLIRQLRGHPLRTIVNKLNESGFRTSRDNQWCISSVSTLINRNKL